MCQQGHEQSGWPRNSEVGPNPLERPLGHTIETFFLGVLGPKFNVASHTQFWFCTYSRSDAKCSLRGK